MSSAQNLRQEETFLAISNARLSEQHFGEVPMHRVAFSFFSGGKPKGTSTKVEFAVIGRRG